METKLNTVNMTAWVHTECDTMDEDALLRLQGAWENPQQKDECSVRMDDLEWDYWMGTEVWQLGGYTWVSRSNFWRRWVVQRWHDEVRVL